MLQQSFARSTSNQSIFAQNLDEKSFYMALSVTDENAGRPNDKCVDSSFIAWIRKYFDQQAGSVTLSTQITGPSDTNPIPVPLFQISKDEATSNCLTQVLNQTITPYYLVDRAHPFKIQGTIRTQKKANVAIGQSILSIAKDLLSFSSANAGLTKLVANAAFTSAADTLDKSLSVNWSPTDQQEYGFEISPWPSDGNWATHKDQAEFRVAGLIATSMGVNTTPADEPAIILKPVYQTSMLGSGRGHYLAAYQIMDQKLVTADGGTLDTILKTGIQGFTTDNALSITDPTQLDRFCNTMHTLFDQFLTEDDTLAAMYAVLKTRTQFMELATLRNAPNCLDAGVTTRLATLNASFTIDDLSRIQTSNRSKHVGYRTTQIAKVLSALTQVNLVGLLDNPDTFRLYVDSALQNALPAPGGMSGAYTGQKAIDALVQLGRFRIACGQASPQQSIATIAMMGLNKTTNQSVGMVVTTSNGDPPSNEDVQAPPTEVVKVSSVSFYPVATIQNLMAGLSSWPDATCPLQ